MYYTEFPKPEDFKHKIRIQLRFNDIDILGHVNNTRYFSFFDLGKARFFETIEDEPVNWLEVRNVIANIDCAFVNSIYFGEEIDLYTRCISVKEKSFVLEQMLVNAETKQIKAICQTVMVSIDLATKKAVPVSARLIKNLCDYDPTIEMLPVKE